MIMGAVTGAAALLIGLLPGHYRHAWVYGAVFVLLGFAEAGVLPGRKTFLIDTVKPAERTTYVAFANTLMGVVTLGFGFPGILVNLYDIQTVIGILTPAGTCGRRAERDSANVHHKKTP
jgi:MFS family permease